MVAGLFAFALFIHDPWPWRLMALTGLLVSGLFIGFSLRQISFLELFGLGKAELRISLFTLAGLLIGCAMGIFTRQHFKLGLFPASLTLIALLAPLVGTVEELVFRGYIQGILEPLNRLFAMVYAAVAHTGYKLLVIYSLGRPQEFDFLFLAQWTLLGGLVFGGLRLLSKSIFPPVLAHAVFDILLYGGSVVAPFWVWS